MNVLRKMLHWISPQPKVKDPSALGQEVVRLFVAQGPAQLLMCDAVAQFLDALEGAAPSRNICLLFGKYAFTEMSGIRAATTTVSRSSTWNRVVDLFDLEDALWADALTDFPTLIDAIRCKTGVEFPDELHVARNWQLTNELVCAAFPDAKPFIYGDGLGLVDSVTMPTFRKISTAFAVVPDFMILIDESSSMTPENTNVRIVPREYFVNAIDRVTAGVTQATLFAGIDLAHAHEAALILTSNYADARLISFEDEIQLALDITLPMLAGISRVYVKPHPRETGGQAAEFARRLSQDLPCEATLFNEETDLGVRYLPLEILLNRPLFKTVIAPFASYPCITLPWLFGIPVRLPSPEEVTSCTHLEPERIQYVVNQLHYIGEYARKMQEWDGRSTLMTHRAKNPEAYAHFKIPDRERRWRQELEFTNRTVHGLDAAAARKEVAESK